MDAKAAGADAQVHLIAADGDGIEPGALLSFGNGTGPQVGLLAVAFVK